MEPVKVKISVVQVEQQEVLADGIYTIRHLCDDRDHMKEVKCEVFNNAFTEPLEVFSKLYILKRPTKPELTMTGLKQGQPINVSWISNDGRPAGNVSMHIAGTTDTLYPLVQTNTRDSSNTYASTLVLTSMKREWNGKTSKCCVSHEMLNETECSNEMTIDYKFPPASVTIQRPQQITADRPYHLVNVTCVITNANPACPAEWSFQDTEVPNTIQHTQRIDDNGHTTANVAFLNASKNDCGKTLVCRARCMDVEKNDSYLLLIPCSPSPSNFEELVPNITKDLHDNATLSMAVTAYPTPTFRWSKLLGECTWTPVTADKSINIITSNLQSDMTFTDKQQSHFGRYKVDVNNGIDGMFSQICKINSLGPCVGRNLISWRIFSGIMDSVTYQLILRDNLLPFTREVFPDGYRLYQDNDSKHKSKSTMKWMEENGVRESLMESPASSPDLNPIENVWATMKDYIQRTVKPKKKDELVDGIKQYWESLTPEKCAKFIDHIHKVLPVVVLNEGGSTEF